MSSGPMIAKTSGSQANVSLDAPGGDFCFISHAHSDHSQAAKSKTARVIASEETAALLGYSKDLHTVEGITLHNAGHVLGSAQALIETNCGRLLYTGDLKTDDSITVKGAKPVECDELIIEGTFANPKIKFQEREEVYSQIASWTEKNSKNGIVVLGGYALGKSQEIIKILNEKCNITPVVPQSVMEFCDVYNKFGVKLDCVLSTSAKGQEIMESDFVAVIPQSHVTKVFAKKMSHVHNTQVKTAIASGWAMIRQFDTDASFALSDHADFESLIGYVKASGAKKVYCVHGNEILFASEIEKRLGIDASAHYPRAQIAKSMAKKQARGMKHMQEGNSRQQ